MTRPGDHAQSKARECGGISCLNFNFVQKLFTSHYIMMESIIKENKVFLLSDMYEYEYVNMCGMKCEVSPPFLLPTSDSSVQCSTVQLYSAGEWEE